MSDVDDIVDWKSEPGRLRSDYHQLLDFRREFDTREDIGPLVGLIARMMRFYLGNPIADFSATSTGPSNVQSLPVNSTARSATLYVSGNGIYYSEAGAVPGTQSLKQAPIGSVITLTGHESLTGFQFCATSTSVSAVLYGTFYT